MFTLFGSRIDSLVSTSVLLTSIILAGCQESPTSSEQSQGFRLPSIPVKMSETEQRQAYEIIDSPFKNNEGYSVRGLHEFSLVLYGDALPKDEQSLLNGDDNYWIKVGVTALNDKQRTQLSGAKSKVMSSISFDFEYCVVTHYLIDKGTVLTPKGTGSLFTVKWISSKVETGNKGGPRNRRDTQEDWYKGSSITSQAAAFRWIAENAPQHCSYDGRSRRDLKSQLHKFAAHGSKLCADGGIVNGFYNSHLHEDMSAPDASEMKLCQQLFVNVGGRKSILSQAMTGL